MPLLSNGFGGERRRDCEWLRKRIGIENWYRELDGERRIGRGWGTGEWMEELAGQFFFFLFDEFDDLMAMGVFFLFGFELQSNGQIIRIEHLTGRLSRHGWPTNYTLVKGAQHG